MNEKYSKNLENSTHTFSLTKDNHILSVFSPLVIFLLTRYLKCKSWFYAKNWISDKYNFMYPCKIRLN